ncbi:MAG TPA: hypothetical protein VN922_04225, partial [Bacteroidia bacterium]|nr:hypothetical protein [Bacteroidia bacterium]
FEGFWGGIRGDSDGYLMPFESLAKTGNFNPDFRMPGFGVLYYPLLLLFSKPMACNILIVIQLLMSSLSVYALALTVKKLLKSNVLFYLTFIIYTTSIYSSLLDPVLISESQTTSTLIFSVYFFARFFDNYKSRELIFSGAMLTWTSFLRPIFTPLLILYFLLVVITLIRAKKRMLPAFLFLLPFTLADGAWMTRNYIHYKEVFPLTRTVYFPEIEHSHLKPMIEFTQSWGGAIWFVDPNAEIYWFMDGKPCTFHTGAKSDSVPFPSYIYTSQFNADSLKTLKIMISRWSKDSTLSVDQKNYFERSIVEKFNRYTQSEKKENPYIFYVKSSEKRMHDMLLSIHTVTKLYINNFITWFYTKYYFFVLWLGIIGSLLMLPFIFKAKTQSILAIIPLFTIIIHPIIIRENENRYLIPAWPFLVICAAYCLYWTYKKIFPSSTIE